MLPLDLHTHTSLSPDGIDSLSALIHRAHEIHLPMLAVTEHVEMNRFFSQGHYGTLPRDYWEIFHHDTIFENSMTTITDAKAELIDDDLTLLSGVEMGQPWADYALCESISRDVRLDIVLASLHEMPDLPDFYGLDYNTFDIPDLLNRYFSQLYAICRWGKFDVLAHMTYPLRYIVGEYHIPVDLNDYKEQICACLSALIDNNCALEINTSGLRQKYGKTLPSQEILRWYYDLHGEMITLGSDAHCVTDLASGIDVGVQLATSIGFTHVCYFKNRKPYFLPLT